MSETNSDRLLTTPEVAEIFAVSTRSVTAWLRDGKLRGVRTPGGTYRVRESAVRAFLDADDPAPVSEPDAAEQVPA